MASFSVNRGRPDERKRVEKLNAPGLGCVYAAIMNRLPRLSASVNSYSISILACTLMLAPCMALDQGRMQRLRGQDEEQVFQNPQLQAQEAAYNDGMNDGMSDAREGRDSNYRRRGFRYNAFTEASYASGYGQGFARGWQAFQNARQQGGAGGGRQAAYQEGFRDGQADRRVGNSPYVGRHPNVFTGFEADYAEGYTNGYNSANFAQGGGRRGIQGGGMVTGENVAAYQQGFSDGKNDHRAGNSANVSRHPSGNPAFAAEYRQGYMDGYNSVYGGAGGSAWGRQGVPRGGDLGQSTAAYQEGYRDGRADRRVGNSPNAGRHPSVYTGFEADYGRGYMDGYRSGF